MVRGAAEQAGSREEFKQGSDEIENIIRTIDNIAFQTNIRVLNTAVEATVNRITLCFCPAGDCVLAGLPCQLVQLLQFLPQSAYGFRRNFSLLIAPAHAEKAPVPHVDGDEQRFDSLPSQCKECQYLFACNGECPKNRFCKTASGEPGLNYLCKGYYQYFDHVAPYMDFMKKELLAERAPANIMEAIRKGEL